MSIIPKFIIETDTFLHNRNSYAVTSTSGVTSTWSLRIPENTEQSNSALEPVLARVTSYVPMF